MRKKAEGITQTKRLCTFFLFFSFFLLFFFLLLSFQSPRRDDDERWLSKSLCYRFPSGCVTACLAYTPSSRGCHPLVALYKGSAVFDERFLIVPDRGGGGGGGEKKERRRKKKGRNRCNGWSDGWSRNADSFSIPRVSMHTREYKCRKLRILCDRSIARRIVPLFDRSWTLETENFDLGFIFTCVCFLRICNLLRRV